MNDAKNTSLQNILEKQFSAFVWDLLSTVFVLIPTRYPDAQSTGTKKVQREHQHLQRYFKVMENKHHLN